MVQEWKTGFHGVGHAYTVSLRREDVAGQQEARFDVLGPPEHVPAKVSLRQHGVQARVWISAGQDVLDVAREEQLGLCSEPPARPVGKEWVVQVFGSTAEERFQVSRVLRLNIGQVRIQLFEQK